MNLRSLTIPSTIESVERYAFHACDSLAYNELNGVKYLGNSEDPYLVLVKAENASIVKLELPESVKVVMANSFESCTELMSITITQNVQYIGDYTFYNCQKLYEVYNLSSLDITRGATTHGYVAYYAKVVHLDKSAESIIGLVDDFLFLLIDGEYYVMDYVGSDTELVFPESYNGQKYNIYKEAFQNRTDLTALVISGGVKSVGEWAFSNCTSIKSISVADGVSSIGQGAFAYCYSLESLTIPFIGQNADGSGNAFIGYIFGNSSDNWDRASRVPSSLKTITLTGGTALIAEAFKGCYNVVTINLPDTITSIGNYAFYECRALKNVNIPNGVRSIGSDAFYLCQSLESIVLPDGIETIPYRAFYGCYSLKSINIPHSVTSIGEAAFVNFAGTEIVIPAGVTSIGRYAFDNCPNLVSVVIPDGVTKLEESTFSGCQSLKTVILPASVKEIGNNAFIMCSALQSIDLSKVEKIGNSAFDCCSSLKNVDLPSVKSVGTFAFGSCTSMERIEFVVLDTLGYYAFYGCTALTYVDLGNSLEKIDECTFSGCTSLKTIYVPDCISFVGNNAFENCNSIEYTVYDGAYYIGSKTNPYVVLVKHNDTNVTAVEIHNDARIVCNKVFYYYGKLQSVTGGNGLITIGDEAFYNCSALKSFNFGSKLEYVGEKAFAYTAITEIILPDSLTTIKPYSFAYNTSLTTLSIGSGLKNIPSYAFSGLTSMTSLDLGSIETIDRGAFSSCTSLAAVTIPASVKTILIDAFYNCTKLSSAVFEDASGWYYEVKKSWGSSSWWEKETISSSTMSNPSKAVGYLKNFNYTIENS